MEGNRRPHAYTGVALTAGLLLVVLFCLISIYNSASAMASGMQATSGSLSC